ncbi:MAG TPA: hypothetical protein VMZ00_07885 [Sporichthya sp.]|nr:hypothetical protein [Sporichthya sp.]
MYSLLNQFLAKAPRQTFVLTIDQIDLLVVGGLPRSARTYPVWWRNEDPSHSHCRAWGDAGFTAHPDLQGQRVTFRPRAT